MVPDSQAIAKVVGMTIRQPEGWAGHAGELAWYEQLHYLQHDL